MRKFLYLLSAIASRPAVWGGAVILAVFSVAVFLMGFSAGGQVWSQGRMSQVYAQLSENLSSATAAGVPDYIVESTREQVNALADVLSQADEREYCKALGEYASLIMQTSGNNDVAFLANQTFLMRLAELEDPVLYQTVTNLPGSMVAVWIIGNTFPYLLPLVLPVLAGWAGSSLFGRGALLGSAPVGRWKSFLMAWLGSWLCSLAALAVAVVPVTILATLLNGGGDPEYPSVFVRSGELVETTTGGLVASFSALYAMASAFLCSVVCCLSWISGKSLVGAVTAAVLLLLPEFPFWASNGTSSPLLMVPATYFDLPRVVGMPSVGAGAEISAVYGAVPTMGAAVLGAWMAVLVVGSAIALAAAERAVSARHVVGGCPDSLVVRGLVLAYGDRRIIDGGDADFRKGVISGLVAPNGYGKTTLLRALAGEARCSASGSMSVGGAPCGPSSACRRLIHYSAGNGGLLPHASIRRQLRLVSVFWGSQRDPREAARLFGVDAFEEKAPGSLSQGMAQLASLALSWETDSPWVLLDEPMNALDPTNVRRVSGILCAEAEAGKCIVMSSHILSNVDELCDEVWCISRKKLELLEGGSAAELYARIYG